MTKNQPTATFSLNTGQRAAMLRTISKFVLVVGLSLTTGTTFAGFREGMEAYDAGNFQNALREWVPLARGGNPNALLALGVLFQGGHGVQKDAVKAHLFFNLAAFRGDAKGHEAQDVIEKSMSATDIKRAKDWALELVERRQYVPTEVERLAGTSAPPIAPPPRHTPPRGTSPVTPPPSTQPVAPAIAAARPFEFKYVCDFEPRYNDKGSGGKLDLATFAPRVPPGYMAVGGFAHGSRDRPDGCVTVVRAAGTSVQGHRLVAPPLGWREVWTDKGSGARMDGSIWSARPPGPDYVCLGSVGQKGYGQPAVANYACVHRCLVTSVPVTEPIWTDEGTGAKRQVSVYRLHFSNTFVAFPNRERPANLMDLNPYASCN